LEGEGWGEGVNRKTFKIVFLLKPLIRNLLPFSVRGEGIIDAKM
jgi:hypothetical protein